MKPLYQIANDREHLLYILQSGTPDEIETARLELEKTQGDISIKCADCISMMKTLEAESLACRLESDRLKERASNLQKQADWLDWYIGKCLDYKPIKAGVFNVSFRKSKQVIITGEVPDQYMRIKTTKEPDKTLLKQDLESGADLSFAMLQENLNLQIK